MFISFPIFLSTIRAAAAVHLCFCPNDANGSTLAAALMDFLLVCTIYIILSRPGGFLVYICLMVWMRIVPKIIQKKGKVDFFFLKWANCALACFVLSRLLSQQIRKRKDLNFCFFFHLFSSELHLFIETFCVIFSFHVLFVLFSVESFNFLGQTKRVWMWS